MPPATLVRIALPSILAMMTSWLGPQTFFSRPMISIGIGSGSVPWRTVQAVPFMPGFTSLRCMISTFPDLGREGVASPAAYTADEATASPKRTAVVRRVIRSTAPVFLIVLCDAKNAGWVPDASHAKTDQYSGLIQRRYDVDVRRRDSAFRGWRTDTRVLTWLRAPQSIHLRCLKIKWRRRIAPPTPLTFAE